MFKCIGVLRKYNKNILVFGDNFLIYFNKDKSSSIYRYTNVEKNFFLKIIKELQVGIIINTSKFFKVFKSDFERYNDVFFNCFTFYKDKRKLNIINQKVFLLVLYVLLS